MNVHLTETYETEYLTQDQLHAEVDWAEKCLRAEIAVIPGEDWDRIAFLFAKLKFLTWCTLFQMEDGRYEVDWAEMIDFIEEEDRLDMRQLHSQMFDYIEEWMFWLDRGNPLNEVPGLEVWDHYAVL